MKKETKDSKIQNGIIESLLLCLDTGFNSV